MSDEELQLSEDMIMVNGLPLPTRKQRKRLVNITLVFCALIIMAILALGDPQNSLHTSGLAWAFGTSVAMIFAYVFGAVADNFNIIKNVLQK